MVTGTEVDDFDVDTLEKGRALKQQQQQRRRVDIKRQESFADSLERPTRPAAHVAATPSTATWKEQVCFEFFSCCFGRAATFFSLQVLTLWTCIDRVLSSFTGLHQIVFFLSSNEFFFLSPFYLILSSVIWLHSVWLAPSFIGFSWIITGFYRVLLNLTKFFNVFGFTVLYIYYFQNMLTVF